MNHGDFTELAKHYHNRPAYSPLLLKKLLVCVNDAHLPLNELKVAEVGAGTGKLTAMLARDFGLQVSAVEPNDAMRAEGIKATAGLGVQWHKGSGEDTGLPSGSADWLIMASSFHWTNPAKSLPEFARVLRGGSSHSVNLSENSAQNSQISQNDNFAGAKSTHPQTPSAREGAYNVAAQRERERERERETRLRQIRKIFLKFARKIHKICKFQLKIHKFTPKIPLQIPISPYFTTHGI